MPQWNPYAPEAPYGMVLGDRSEFVKKQRNNLMKFLVKEYFKKK